jgi:RNA polymerase sigma-70 factor, ECF subfamily
MEDKVAQIWKDFDVQLKTLICAKMNNRNECFDVLQDVYVKVIKNIDKIESIDNIPAYLNAIANNAVADHFRKESKNKRIVLNEENVDKLTIVDEIAVNDVDVDACIHCIEPGIEALPPKYKDAFVMSELQGIPQKEVAEKLGISLSGAKSRVQRAREKLREEVMRCCHTSL